MNSDELVKKKLEELRAQRSPQNIKSNEKYTQKGFYVGVVKNTPYFPDTTMVNLMAVSNIMKRVFNYTYITGSALTVARKNLMENLKKRIIENGDDPELTYVLLIDSDIIIKNTPQELAEIFKEAEEKDINISALYKKANFTSVIIGVYSNDFAPVLLDENHEDWNRYNKYIPTYRKWYYPIGFYYGRYMPYDYIWRMDMKGEDIYFVEQNDFLWERTFIDKRVKLGHIKEIIIS